LYCFVHDVICWLFCRRLQRGERRSVVKLSRESDGLADVVTENPRAVVCHAVVVIVRASYSDADDLIRTAPVLMEFNDVI